MHEMSQCHTLDRNNYQAQVDCNTAITPKLKSAADAQFFVDFFPYTKTE